MFGIDLNQHSIRNAKSSHGSLTQACHQQLKRITEMFLKMYVFCRDMLKILKKKILILMALYPNLSLFLKSQIQNVVGLCLEHVLLFF